MFQFVASFPRRLRIKVRPLFYGEKLSRERDHRSSQLNFNERLYEKPFVLLPDPRAVNSARACPNCFALTELTR